MLLPAGFAATIARGGGGSSERQSVIGHWADALDIGAAAQGVAARQVCGFFEAAANGSSQVPRGQVCGGGVETENSVTPH